MLRIGLEWFKLLTVSLIAVLAWQVSRGAERTVSGPKAEWHPFIAMMSADTDERLMEQDYSGSNELVDGYDDTVDCVAGVIHMLPPQLDQLLVNCRTAPPYGELIERAVQEPTRTRPEWPRNRTRAP